MPAPSPVQPPLPEWSLDWKRIQPHLSKARRSMAALRSPSLRVMRVSQLDSDILDLELLDILKEQLWSALSLFKPALRDTWEPELMAVLNLVLYRLSVYDSSATYGAQLQNLKYRNEWKHRGALESIAKDAPLTRTQKIAFGLLTVGGQYFWTRASRLVTLQGWSDIDDEADVRYKIHRVLHAGERYWKAFSLVNFLIFLYNGKYRTLVDRILGMRLVYARKSLNRQISFEFLNRQMVWHAFTEFLLFLVPLINVEKLKLRLTRMLLPKSFLVSKGYDRLPISQCAICHDSLSGDTQSTPDCTVHIPYETNCGHYYCYCCIQSKITIYGGEWPCLRCGEKVESIQKHVEKVEDEQETREEKGDTLDESYVVTEKE